MVADDRPCNTIDYVSLLCVCLFVVDKMLKNRETDESLDVMRVDESLSLLFTGRVH